MGFDDFSQNLFVGTAIPYPVGVNDHDGATVTSAEAADFGPFDMNSVLAEEFAGFFDEVFAFTVAPGAE